MKRKTVEVTNDEVLVADEVIINDNIVCIDDNIRLSILQC